MRTARLRRTTVLCCAFLLFAIAASPAGATTFAPNRFDDPVGPGAGTSCTPPMPAGNCSLRGAIAAAQSGDTVQLSAGTYTLSFGGVLVLKKKITILGPGPATTTIEQTEPDRVIKVENQVGLTMSGVTITGGEYFGDPGQDGSSPGQNGQDGQGGYGAGIDGGGPVTLTDVVVTGNSAYGGDAGDGAPGTGAGAGGKGGRGGFADGAGISGGNPLVLTRVAVTDNLAQPGSAGDGGNGGPTGVGGAGGPGGSGGGGGISIGGSSLLTATDTLIADNHATTTPGGHGGAGGINAGAGGAGGQGESADGGGLFSNGVVRLTNVTFTGNTAAGATGGVGGIARSSTVPTVGGAGGIGFGGVGGAVALFNGAAGQFASVTIAGNGVSPGTGGNAAAGSDGGAAGSSGQVISSQGGNVFVTSASLTIRGTIVSAGQAQPGKENCALGGGGTLTSAGHNLEDRHQCIASAGPGDLFNTPAGLGPLADNGGPTQTLALLPASAAIDAGEASCVDAAGQPLGDDQRGDPRGNPCDIGAFEVQPPPPTPPDSSNPSGGGGGSLPVPKPDPKPHLTALKLSAAKLRNGQKATISFTLSNRANVTFTLSAPGVKSGRKCVARSRTHPSGKACQRPPRSAGAPKAVAAAAGTTRFAWKPHGLAPGGYTLTATPAGGAGLATHFTLRKPRASQ